MRQHVAHCDWRATCKVLITLLISLLNERVTSALGVVHLHRFSAACIMHAFERAAGLVQTKHVACTTALQTACSNQRCIHRLRTTCSRTCNTTSKQLVELPQVPLEPYVKKVRRRTRDAQARHEPTVERRRFTCDAGRGVGNEAQGNTKREKERFEVTHVTSS